jgi:hypothetical protein
LMGLRRAELQPAANLGDGLRNREPPPQEVDAADAQGGHSPKRSPVYASSRTTSLSPPAASASRSTSSWIRNLGSFRVIRGRGTRSAGFRGRRPSRTARSKRRENTRCAWRTVPGADPRLSSPAVHTATSACVTSASRYSLPSAVPPLSTSAAGPGPAPCSPAAAPPAVPAPTHRRLGRSWTALFDGDTITIHRRHSHSPHRLSGRQWRPLRGSLPAVGLASFASARDYRRRGVTSSVAASRVKRISSTAAARRAAGGDKSRRDQSCQCLSQN